MKTEIIFNINSKDIYILSIIKNIIIYIIKINWIESNDKSLNYNFGDIKSKGIINLGNNNVFIYYDKKDIIINIIEAFISKINPIDSFQFPFDILFAYYYSAYIILISESHIFYFFIIIKKLKKK